LRALLDVNVLIALFDPDHVHHRGATEWLRGNITEGWASCAITQNGCVRIMSQPRYPNPFTVREIVSRLGEACSTEHHHFLPGNVSILDSGLIDHTRLLQPKQLTDIYLLALAHEHQCRFVSFDQSIAWECVRGARENSVITI
jgi:hypothetical protein